MPPPDRSKGNMATVNKADPQYLIVVQKVTSLGSGESIQASINIPASSTEDEIYGAIKKICNAIDRRLVESNEKVLAITAAQKEAFDQLQKEQEDESNARRVN